MKVCLENMYEYPRGIWKNADLGRIEIKIYDMMLLIKTAWYLLNEENWPVE